MSTKNNRYFALVEALPKGVIPAACRADLLAVADALRQFRVSPRDVGARC